MKKGSFIALLMVLSSIQNSTAQKASDSLQVVNTMKELFAICRSVDFNDPKTKSLGTFYKAAPYIVYSGDDQKRTWKDFTNYNNTEEKKVVDQTCLRINEMFNAEGSYQVVRYYYRREAEGIWHVLLVTYKKKDIVRRATFAFFQIGNRYGLGDIN